jgi:hypothetical protein
MPLFTASGERAWAPGWDPVGDDDCWRTTAHGHTTYWLTVDRTPTSARYARVTPGDTAGTVAVECAPDGQGTLVTVTYDLRPLEPAGEARLASFRDGYAAMLGEWQRLTSALL